jgi:hypothetical protein
LPQGRRSHAKIACDCWLVAFKLYPSGCQLHANCTRVAASRRQIPIDFFHFACDWRPQGYNLHATGSHSGTICMRLAATRVQFVCDWPPLAYNLNVTGRQSHAIFACDWRTVACKAASFLKACCQKNYLN